MKLEKLSTMKTLGKFSSPLLVTDNDLDGIIGGAIVNKQKKFFPIWFSTRKDVIGDLIETGEIFDYDCLIMVDCSPKTKERLELLQELFYESLFIIDHHESFRRNLKEWKIQEQFNIDTTKSSTMIVYELFPIPEFFLEDRVKEIVIKTNNYDMWNEIDSGFEDAKLLNEKLNYLGELAFRSNINTYLSQEDKDILKPEQQIGFLDFIRRNNQYIREKAKQAYINNKLAITFAERCKSEIGNEILKQYNDIDGAIVVDISNNTVSVRSNRGKALSIASKISLLSGGHENASGCRVDYKQEILSMILSNV